MKDRYLSLKHNPAFGKCPLCEEHLKLHHAQVRSIKESAVHYISFHRLYRCSNCGWRGFLFTFVYSKKSLFNLFFFSVIAAAASALVVQILIRMN